VNLRDVASLAGVSPATVSRVFSGNTTVSEQTREKVRAAANELGYVVNRLAQSMMGAGHRPLAIVTAGLTDSATATILSGAEHVATEQNTLLATSLTHGDLTRERRIIENLREQRTSGVLLLGATTPGRESEERLASYSQALASIGARLILCDHPYLPSLPDILTVNYDQIRGVRKVVELLAAKGHSQIAFLGWANSTTANQRLLGFSMEMKQAGLSIDSSSVVSCPNEIADAHLATLMVLQRPNRPTAIVCVSDVVAVGVYRAARDLELKIPDQLAVVGFGETPFAGDLSPGLTSIRAPFFEVGVRGAELALGVDGANQRVELPTELVVRESSG
jgi:LacI family transcriptional regulator